MRGVWCATLTPLDGSGNPDTARLADHVASLLGRGVDGVVPFGTTGEGPSFSVAERSAGLEALVAAGIPPSRIVPATGCAAFPDTVALTRHALSLGCAGVLVMPPFFFKEPSDDGVFANYAGLIDTVADARLRVYLYHIPQVTSVPLGEDVIARLCAAYPGTIAGVKDSAGDLAHSLRLRERFPDLAVLVGHEPHLPAMLAAGGAGTVCGLANLFPQAMRRLYDTAETLEEADALAAIKAMLAVLFDYSLLPAFKALMATMTGRKSWQAVRPPLTPLPMGACAAMLDRLREAQVL